MTSDPMNPFHARSCVWQGQHKVSTQTPITCLGSGIDHINCMMPSLISVFVRTARSSWPWSLVRSIPTSPRWWSSSPRCSTPTFTQVMEGSDWLTLVKLISYWCRWRHLPGHSAEQVESNLRRVSHPHEYSVPGELGQKNIKQLTIESLYPFLAWCL